MPSVPPRARQSPSQLAIRSLRRKFLMAELRTTMECEHASRQLWRCRLGTLKSKGRRSLEVLFQKRLPREAGWRCFRGYDCCPERASASVGRHPWSARSAGSDCPERWPSSSPDQHHGVLISCFVTCNECRLSRCRLELPVEMVLNGKTGFFASDKVSAGRREAKRQLIELRSSILHLPCWLSHLLRFLKMTGR